MRSLFPRNEPDVSESPSVELVLRRAQSVVVRRPSERAKTWQRVQGRVQGLGVPSPRAVLVVNWARASLVATIVAAGVILSMRLVQTPLSLMRTTLKTTSGVMSTRRISDALTRPASAAATKDREVPQEDWITVDLRSDGQLFATATASFQIPSVPAAAHEPYVVTLDRGELCAQVSHRDQGTQGPFIVQAPTIRAVVVGTRFCVFAGATPAASWVKVEEGLVQVERVGAGSLLAAAGALVHAGATHPPDEGPLAALDPTSPIPRAEPTDSTGRTARPAGRAARGTLSSCLAGPVELRERCLWHEAGGEGLAAENALYLLGTMARDRQHDGTAALSLWETYRHRFPQGALSAETSWNIFSELLAERRYDQALSESDEFLRRHENFSRVGEVKLRRAEILRDLGRMGEAVDAYRKLLAEETRPTLRDDALFGLGTCQARLGAAGEAQATWERYQREFSAGRHRAEVVRQLNAAQGGTP
jgi:hypothetical protein